MAAKKSNSTFQDALQLASRYVKYWKTGVLLFMLGVVMSAMYFTYGKPGFYSRSLVSYADLALPVHSETSDGMGPGRWARASLVLQSALNSRWLVEHTASRLGLVEQPGQFEYIRANFVSKVRATAVPGNLFQIEVYAYHPWLVREWPEAMLAAYQEYTVKQRALHREAAVEGYTEEMQHLKEQIDSERNATAKFEEENQIIEQYISNNSLESVPSEMLTIRTRMDSMDQILAMVKRDDISPVEKLSLIKKFRGMPVPVGTIMRRSLPDTLVEVGRPRAPGTVSSLTSDAIQIPGSPQQTGPTTGNSGSNSQVIVVPSMVEELEPWERTEKELRAARQEREQLAQTLLPGHELMRKVDQQIAQLEIAMNDEVTTGISSFQLERDHLQARFEELQKKMPNYRKVLNDFDQFKQDYTLMTSGKVYWEGAYANLKRRLAAMDFTGIDIRMNLEFQGFTMMRDEDPVSPNKKTLLIYGLVLGAGLAGGTCFGLEKFRSTTSLVSETERITGLPAVGVLPLTRSEDDFKEIFANRRVPGEQGYDLRESFRIIRCSLPLHVAKDNRCQVIMVTSARPGEGKTVASSLLARSFAEAGQKTVLIDADLRRGRINQLLDNGDNGGLRKWLDGEAKSLEEITTPAEGSNLDVIVRGGYSSSAIEALGRPRFLTLVDELRRKYDRIIIDTPPVLGLADPLMIAPATDGVMLVIRADKTTQRDVLTGLEQISSTKAPMFGFLLNGVDLSKIENYYYYSSYYPKYYDPGYMEPSAA